MARPQENQGKHSHDSVDSFPFKSLYNLLDSVQGLDHLTESVALDEIVEADEKAKRLIQRLSLLQINLANLDTIKRCLAGVREVTAGKSSDQRLEPKADSVKKPAQVQTGKAPSNLIPFPGTSKTAREDSKQNPVDTTSSSDEKRKSGPADSALEKALSLAETHLAIENRRATKVDDWNHPLPNKDTDRSSEKTASATVHATIVQTKVQSELSTLVKETSKQPESPEPMVASVQASHKESFAANPNPERVVESAAKLEISFDQTLLNNLIKDYGEFTIYTTLSTDAKKEPTPVAGRIVVPPPAPTAHALKAAVAHDAVERRQRAEGDLDRKLKRLMRDYGKIDIYSAGKKDNVKVVGLTVFALAVISLISASFFSFKKAPDVPTQTPPARTAPTSLEGDAGSKRPPADTAHPRTGKSKDTLTNEATDIEFAPMKPGIPQKEE